jgi:hypothetical protein
VLSSRHLRLCHHLLQPQQPQQHLRQRNLSRRLLLWSGADHRRLHHHRHHQAVGRRQLLHLRHLAVALRRHRVLPPRLEQEEGRPSHVEVVAAVAAVMRC